MRFRLLALSSLRFYGRHPWQLLLAVAGIALGVAVFVGIELANDSARRAFDASSGAASDQTTHRLLPISGRMPRDVYTELKRDRRFVDSAPLIEVPVTLQIPGGRPAELILEGVDLIEEPAVRGPRAALGGGADATRLLTEPWTILLPESVRTRFGFAVGDRLRLDASDRSYEVTVIGSVDDGAGGGTRIVSDIATADALAGEQDGLTRIDLRLDDAAAEALGAALPAGTVLVPSGTEDQILRELTRAFNTNLTALGLLALVVGMFLIYSTISFTIVQRRRSIAVLRAVGLERRELLASLLGEALAIGVAGTLLGLVLGRALSAGLLELVLRTLDDLYFRRALAAADPSVAIFVLSAALGIGATLLSALVPALMATRREITQSNRSRVEHGARQLAKRFAMAALPTAGLAIAILFVADRGLTPAFVALFLVIVAGAMLIPLATQGFMRIAENPVAAMAGLPGRMATRGVSDSLSRTGIATAALAVAVATVMSVGLMIASFRLSLIDWIDSTITADLYVDIDPEWPGDIDTALAAIEALPDVTGTSRMQVARIATASGTVTVRAQSPGPEGYGIDVTAPAVDAATLLSADRTVLVAEPLAYRLDLTPGDSLDLPTPGGIEAFEVAGIYRDYNTGGSDLVISLPAYRQWFDDPSLSTVGVHVASGADAQIVTDAIRDALGPQRPTRIRSTDFIREFSLVIFDRTFQVTEVLRLLAAIVAFLGILSALMALGLEREREFAVLRSLGMSIRQLFGQNLAQTGLLGLTAGLAAIPLGTALAWMLVHVINRRSFGWTMDFVVSAPTLVGGIVMAVVAAVLAGIYPAWVGARADMGLAWRDD
ncbi:MAG TPA: FtsX-like permease family protein [Gammaproteobacteria bacterium]|nr:FtsX-like permease family protein [Gammaproteobacteria bacterium]